MPEVRPLPVRPNGNDFYDPAPLTGWGGGPYSVGRILRLQGSDQGFSHVTAVEMTKTHRERGWEMSGLREELFFIMAKESHHLFLVQGLEYLLIKQIICYPNTGSHNTKGIPAWQSPENIYTNDLLTPSYMYVQV